MSGKLFGYARVSVAGDADANNLEIQRRALDDCEQVFEDVGSGASWNRPGLNRLKAALQPGDCMKVEALDRLGRAMLRHSHVLNIRGESYWLREKRQPGILSSHRLLGAAAENGNDSCPD